MILLSSIPSDISQELLPHLLLTVQDKFTVLAAVDVLKLCDQVRDEILPNLGVRLEDHEGLQHKLIFSSYSLFSQYESL